MSLSLAIAVNVNMSPKALVEPASGSGELGR